MLSFVKAFRFIISYKRNITLTGHDTHCHVKLLLLLDIQDAKGIYAEFLQELTVAGKKITLVDYDCLDIGRMK